MVSHRESSAGAWSRAARIAATHLVRFGGRVGVGFRVRVGFGVRVVAARHSSEKVSR